MVGFLTLGLRFAASSRAKEHRHTLPPSGLVEIEHDRAATESAGLDRGIDDAGAEPDPTAILVITFKVLAIPKFAAA